MNDISRVTIHFVELLSIFGFIKVFNITFVEYAFFSLLIWYCYLLGSDEYVLQTKKRQ